MNFKKLARWYYSIHKRLLRKVSFLLILCLIPLSALLMGRLGGQESGLVRVAVASQDAWDGLPGDIARALQEAENVLSVTVCQEEQAIWMVQQGQADTAWILQKDLAARIHETVSGKDTILVRVVSGEDNILTRAAREKLYGALFREISHEVFIDFIRTQLPEVTLSDGELRSVLDSNTRSTELVEFVFSHTASSASRDSSILLSPLRGLLSVVMLLAGMAATMYFKHDEKEHVYGMLSLKSRRLVLLATNLAALCITAVFVTLALLLSGSYTNFLRETLCMLAFILAAAGFCSLLGTLCPNNTAMGIALPLVLVLTMTFCPVFVNVKRLRPLQIFLPPYYYLYGIGQGRYTLEAVMFALAAGTGVWFLYPALCRKRNL